MADERAPDVTTRRCNACGETYAPGLDSEKHGRCAAPGAASDPDATRRAPPGGTGAEPEAELPPDARLASGDPKNIVNQYILVTLLGKGGMGSVWKAWDRTLSRWVAMKFLNDADAESIRRFRREARLAARLVHPNIAPIHEIGLAGERHFIAMEYIDGVALDQLKVPIPEMVELFVDVCLAVEAAHKAGVIHRDVKPQNVIVAHEGRRPYVMDFGLAKSQKGDGLSISGSVLGTPAFMSPEQASGKLDQVDAQSDVYSLGATLYAVLCHRPPFSGQTAMEILVKACQETPPPPRKVDPEIPEALEAVILRSMARNKKDRTASVADFRHDLDRFLSGHAVTTARPSPSARPGARSKIILAAVLIPLVIGAAFLFRNGPTEPRRAPPIPRDPAVFDLKIAGTPHTRVVTIARDGQALPFAATDIPMMLTGLKPGAYAIAFQHPERGTREFSFQAKPDFGGKVWQITGPFGVFEIAEVKVP